MLTVFSPDHAQHHARAELIDGQMLPAVEVPARAEQVLTAVRAAGLGAVVEPDPDGPADRAALERVHEPRYLDFLEGAHRQWLAEGHDGDALPLCWPARGLQGPEPEAIDGRLGYWSFDAGTPVTSGTWAAATAAARCARTAALVVAEGVERLAFALCRPPGHHAYADQMGGYCFLNNAAVAAQVLRDSGAGRVVVLDVDYHHGNGTQGIFWARDDVLTLSIHADPRQEYPYFAGYASEVGPSGRNRNFPLPSGTAIDAWAEALEAALGEVRAFGADALVVPLGVDTYEGDPISRFRLTTSDFPGVGAAIGALGLPTVVTMEGGYAVDALGANVAAFLTGLAAAHVAGGP
ncbi:MAG: histone deacetylase family protein [Acidimicrobiia bacterium]|nr:histone deacetylase family protein [Acidimicrobiia bacterium]